MFQVSIDPASSSVPRSVRAPVQNDQTDESDDFGSLVDSNTNAAASSVSSYTRSQQAQDVSHSSQNDASAAQANQPPAPSHNEQPPSQQQSAKPSSGHGSEPAPADRASRPRNRSAKDDKQDDHPDSKKSAGADAANPNGTVVAPVAGTVANSAQTGVTASGGDGSIEATQQANNVAAKTAAANAADKNAADKDAAPDNTAKAVIDSANGLPVSGSGEQASAAANGVTSSQLNGADAATTGLVAAKVKGGGGQTGGPKATTQPANGRDAGKLAAAKAPDDQSQTQNAKPETTPDSTLTANGDGVDTPKSRTTVATKSDAAQSAASATHDHNGVGSQTLQPDISFQSVLNLQAQPQAQQPLTSNFTVTNAGSTGSAQALSAPVPLSGLAVDIASKVAAGNTSFQIRLDPADLGRIDVRLDVDKHGQVTSHLTVEQPATLDMLRNEAPKLQQALENAGLKTGDGGLQFSLRDQSSQGRNDNGGQNQNSQRLIVSEDVPVVKAAGGSYSRLRGSSSGVDISI